MHIGLIGLGKMGGNMRTRLRNKGIEVTGYARSKDVTDVDSVAELVAALPTPRIVWVMVPHGAPTDSVIDELTELLSESATSTAVFRVVSGVFRTGTASWSVAQKT